jgi:5-methylcytosine-specific restriction endonuclease McrBC GTP-binding regulatory subunit McrB
MLNKDEKQILQEHYCFVQFHPSYDYTDFVEGLRPTKPDDKGNIGFERKEGVFKEFCKKAQDYNQQVNIDDATYSRYSNGVILEAVTKVNIDDVAYSGDADSFEDIYKSIYDDIKSGKIKGFKNPRFGSFDVTIIGGEIAFGGDKRSESKENLKLMFDYYLSNKIFDLSYTRDDYFGLISKLTNGKTKTIDYTYYYGILQEMLNRIKVKTPTVSPVSAKVEKHLPLEEYPFIFVVDEINRGEISKIFGELFFSIDPGYRGEKGTVQTQYQNMISKAEPYANGFYVPDNIYIIGTMNDIDRSVECMDFAIRRRFAWKEIKSIDRISMWNGKIETWKEEAKQRMLSLNKAIEETQGLTSAYHIGPAYFLKLENYDGNFDELWENHLRGVLFEYLRGIPNAQDELEKLYTAYNLQ